MRQGHSRYTEGKFQFHKGAIKSFIDVVCLYVCDSMFQFHKGAIKSELLRLSDESDAGFNSIKVRLKDDWRTLSSCSSREFQFHKGAIKSELRIRLISSSSLVSIP